MRLMRLKRPQATTIAVSGVLAFLLATNPVVADAAARIGSADIRNGSVRSIDIQDGGVTGVDVRNRSLSAADLAPGTVPKVRWALVDGDHATILAQSGGISITSASSGGVYLDMGGKLSRSAISATQAYTDSEPGLRGAIMTTVCGGAPFGTCVAPGTNNRNHLWVFTQNPGNTSGSTLPFYVTAIG